MAASEDINDAVGHILLDILLFDILSDLQVLQEYREVFALPILCVLLAPRLPHGPFVLERFVVEFACHHVNLLARFFHLILFGSLEKLRLASL